MKKKGLITLIVGMCLVLVIAMLPLMGACAKPAPPEVIELTLQTNMVTTHNRYETIVEPWAREIEERTNGRLKITLYPIGAIVKEPEMYDALITGTIDIGHAGTYVSPGRFPLLDCVNIPGLGIQNDLTKSRTLWSIYNKFPEVQAEFKDVKLLWIFAMISNMITSKTPIRTLADLKGMKIRAAPGPMFEAVERLGGVPVDVNWGDIYSSLEKGVIDGVATQQQGAVPMRFYEVCPYCTWFDMGGVEFWQAMSLNAWNSLPNDIQKVFEELSGDHGVELTGMQEVKYEEWGWNFTQEQGTEVIELPPEDQAKAMELLAPIPAKWAADMDAKGLPGTEILEEVKKLYAASK